MEGGQGCGAPRTCVTQRLEPRKIRKRGGVYVGGGVMESLEHTRRLKIHDCDFTEKTITKNTLIFGAKRR